VIRQTLSRRTIALLAAIMIACSATVAACGTSPPDPGDSISADQPVRSPTVPASPTAAPTATPVPFVPAPWAASPQAGVMAPPAINARAAVVLDDASAEVLFAKDADMRLAPASLTKIATAIVALERGNLDAEVIVDVDSRTMRRSTVMGLIPGDRFTLRDLLYGMMLPSGNDAALAVGRHLSGSDAAFVAEMNRLAARLGLRDTHFANPHGLGARDHFTSARDLALLSRYAMSLPEFARIVGTAQWLASGSRDIALYNINSFLFMYSGADGLKTGYTRSAGSTLAASAVRGQRRLFVVLLNAPQREADAMALMDWVFNDFVWPGG
jgi:D-alanyl-D-alanine carboxypeptidase (penicillin-binding protein 5/6)